MTNVTQLLPLHLRIEWAVNAVPEHGLTAPAAAVLMQLAILADKTTGTSFPRHATLAARTALSRSTVIRAQADLEAAGLVAVSRTQGEKNVYTLLMDLCQSDTPPVSERHTPCVRATQASEQGLEQRSSSSRIEEEDVSHETREPKAPAAVPDPWAWRDSIATTINQHCASWPLPNRQWLYEFCRDRLKVRSTITIRKLIAQGADSWRGDPGAGPAMSGATVATSRSQHPALVAERERRYKASRWDY